MSIFIPCLVSPVLKNMRMASHILHRNKEEKHFNDLWWPWPLTLGYEIFTKIFFFVMWAICVHELNRIWAFSLDENHFEINKVMTLTFELENGNHTYLIKLWYILYLNTKFGGCSLKAVYVANIYITLPQRRKNQWPLVTLTFEMQSPKKPCTFQIVV